MSVAITCSISPAKDGQESLLFFSWNCVISCRNNTARDNNVWKQSTQAGRAVAIAECHIDACIEHLLNTHMVYTRHMAPLVPLIHSCNEQR